jgi:hypothetical protein
MYYEGFEDAVERSIDLLGEKILGKQRHCSHYLISSKFPFLGPVWENIVG